MADGKPTLHHLNNSQSQRILWLLEELHVDYDLKLYKRHESGPQQGRAPDELKELNPMGKSPQLVTSDGRIIFESSVIASYLIDKYDKAGRFKGDATQGNDQLRDDMLSSFANASLGCVLPVAIFTDLMVSQAPFILRFLFAAVRSTVRKAYLTAEFDTTLKYLESELRDQDYFMGKNPGRADFMLSWPLDNIAQWKFVDLSQYPKVLAWHERCHARDAWKRSLERGNGYTLTL